MEETQFSTIVCSQNPCFQGKRKKLFRARKWKVLSIPKQAKTKENYKNHKPTTPHKKEAKDKDILQSCAELFSLCQKSQSTSGWKFASLKFVSLLQTPCCFQQPCFALRIPFFTSKRPLLPRDEFATMATGRVWSFKPSLSLVSFRFNLQN